jgi:hypothetical protein
VPPRASPALRKMLLSSMSWRERVWSGQGEGEQVYYESMKRKLI